MSHTSHGSGTHDDQRPAASGAPHPHTAPASASGHGGPHPSHTEVVERRPWTVMALALAVQLLVVVDISVVNTALPTISDDLNLASGDLQWMVTSYLLLSGGGLLLGGRIADLLSRRAVFITGVGMFTAASLANALSSDGTQLIVGRALQGAGAALMTPAALAIITTHYAGAQRARGLALWGAIGGLGIALGVALGGVLTTWLGWQSIFWINVPVGAIAIVLAGILLPSQQTDHVGFAKFDLVGALTALTGLATLMYTIAGTESDGWTSTRTIVGTAVAMLALGAFVFVERRADQPLVHPHTWSIRSLVSSTLVMLAITGLLIATVFLTSIFIQTTLGYSALRSGLAFLPLAGALVVGTHLAGHLGAHLTGRATAALGLAVVASGSLLLSRADAAATYAANVLPGLLIVGLGAGIVFAAVSAAAMSGIPAQHSGMASGFLMTGHEVGAALGVSVLSAVASAAGVLTTQAGAASGYQRGFVVAMAIAVGFGVIAAIWMPATRSAGGSLHHHH